jgi:osmotically-inducible protein OsmY
MHGQTQILGGFATSSTNEVDVPRSSDGQLGDEAIAEAVRQELREDAATTDLQVEVEVNAGVVVLRGTVSDLDDVDNAEAVAARVPGVIEVQEFLTVPTL